VQGEEAARGDAAVGVAHGDVRGCEVGEGEDLGQVLRGVLGVSVFVARGGGGWWECALVIAGAVVEEHAYVRAELLLELDVNGTCGAAASEEDEEWCVGKADRA
jgi:hypothetical protein